MTNAHYNPGIAELGRKNQPGGYAGLDANGDLVGPIINRSMLYAELLDGVVPEVGEFVYCTDTRDLHIGDGVTVGGNFHSAPAIVLPKVTGSVSNGSLLEIGSRAIKANRIYRLVLRANWVDFDAGTRNNGKLTYSTGANASIVAPINTSWWVTTAGSQLLTALTSGANPVAVTVPDNVLYGAQQGVQVDALIASTTDHTLSINVTQKVSSANALNIMASSILVQRIA